MEMVSYGLGRVNNNNNNNNNNSNNRSPTFLRIL